jgi:hypothetical protein
MAVTPATDPATPAGPLTLEAQLRSVDGGATLWEAKYLFDPAKPGPIAVELTTPAAEGAYRLSFALRAPTGFTRKLTPWQQPAPVAARDVEIVVIDPATRLPHLTDVWDLVQTVNPADTKWWRRVPDWTQLDRLPGLTAPRSLGNVKPTLRNGAGTGFVELPAPSVGAEPSWQAYALSVREVGAPHVVEVELPAGEAQQLAVSVIEPDAAGRVQTFGREAGVFVDGGFGVANNDLGPVIRHRLKFWPRTASPVLLLANQSPSRPATYGAIRVLRQHTEESPTAAAATANATAPTSDRLVAAYISAPRLAKCLGAAEEHDPASALSVDGWGTFLIAAQRLAQELRSGGFNGAIVSIAADGGSLAPIDALGSSPRYDTGPLATSGSDPLRKDVLEALLRVFDREGLRLIPAIELATPLPRLEALRNAGEAAPAGVACVGYDGRSWSERFPGKAAGARYNILEPRVQQTVAEVVDQLVARYGEHVAFGGVAVQLSGRGFGVLPGLAWGLDDATTARFANAAQLELPREGADRFQQRANLLLGPEAARWTAWRRAEMTKFYADLAQRVKSSKGEPTLVLCTENLFSGAEASQRLRQAVSGRGSVDEAAAELGVDLAALAATPGVQLLRPRRLASDESLQARAIDWQINSEELDRLLANQPRAGELFFHGSQRLRLASFDAQSPFGADRTYLSVTIPGYPGGPAARRSLATALAARDFFAWVEGAELLPLVQDDEAARLRRLFLELPGRGAEVRVERRQPATLRVYRTADATTLGLVNESPWPVTIELPIELSAPTAWRELGLEVAGATSSTSAASSQPAGAGVWSVTLPAYGVAARRYESRGLRLGALAPRVSEEARTALDARINEIERRKNNLDVERAYPQLQNPGFELAGADGLMLGWQPRIGQSGLVATDDTAAATGAMALHLRSEDALGVAAQSHLFPIPATGQLAVRARVRVKDMAKDARVYAWVEFDAEGVPRREYAALGEGQLNGDWTTCEFAVDDLPLASTGQMRVQFHLAGQGEAWVDDIELFDVRLAGKQRMRLLQLLFAARTALDEGQLVACQRLIDGYLPRYVIEYVPATPPADDLLPAEVRVATRPDDAAPAKGGSPGIGDRLRQLTPPIFKR